MASVDCEAAKEADLPTADMDNYMCTPIENRDNEAQLDPEESLISSPHEGKSIAGIPLENPDGICENVDTKIVASNNLFKVKSQSPNDRSSNIEVPSQISSANISNASALGSTWVCKNSACKAVLSQEDIYCKRCSCCVCHQFDDNKDPSLWLVCSPEICGNNCCGASCHIECALKFQKAGCVALGDHIQLDGNYCCASCGNIVRILGCWRRQLVVAKDARRVDVLCYRILLSCRLLHGTSRYKVLHQIAEVAKAKLEEEVGSLDGVSARMGRSLVGRLPVAREVQKLCCQAIEKADELLRSSGSEVVSTDSLPPACKMKFEEVTSSSLVIALKEVPSTSEFIKGYKLWHWKSSEQPANMEPAIFSKDQRKIVISKLQPCTEYAFRIISFSEDREIGHSESKCFTKSVEILHKNAQNNGPERCPSSVLNEGKNEACRSQSLKIRKSAKALMQFRAQEDAGEDDSCRYEAEGSGDRGGWLIPENRAHKQAAQSLSRELDLNVASVPDLNVDVGTLLEVDGCSSEKNGRLTSNGSGDSQTCDLMRIGAMEFQSEGPQRYLRKEKQTCEDGSTLLIGSPSHFTRKLGSLDDDYEHSVKVIRWLERNEHIGRDFRTKFLTWFSLRSTEQERRIVSTFIRTLIEEPTCLAEQLIDSFEEIVSSKKQQSSFCSKLWH